MIYPQKVTRIQRLGLGLLALVAAVSLRYNVPDFQVLEMRLYDMRVRWMAGFQEPSDDIVVLALDNESLERMESAVGRWPWPRIVFGGVVEFCSLAKAVGFDILFPERDWQFPEYDDQFAQHVSEHDRVVSATYLDNQRQSDEPVAVPKRFLLPRTFPSIDVLPFDCAYLHPYDNLMEASKGLGFINGDLDDDGVTRHYSLAKQRGVNAHPSLALATLIAAGDVSADSIRSERGTTKVGEHALHTDKRGRFLYCPPMRKHTTYSLIDIIEAWNKESKEGAGPIKRETFKDKIVLIGTIATGLPGDETVTPLGGGIPGVYVHAAAIDNLLHGKHYRVPPIMVELLLLLLMSFAPTLFNLERPKDMILVGASLAALYLSAILVAAYWAYTMIPVTGPLMGWLFSCSSLTFIYWYLERRRRSYLERLDKAKQQFTDMLVHDLKNRTASIKMSLSLVKERFAATDLNAATLVALVDASTNRLLNDTSALLDIRKMQEGMMVLKQNEMSVASLLENVMSEHESSAEFVGNKLTCELGSAREVQVCVDSDIFVRILSNLVWNALHHAKPDTDIVIGCAVPNEQHVDIFVANRGEIVPENKRKELFRPFISGVVQAQKTKRRGTGLGLTFCKLAVEAHGGAIRLESPWEEQGDGVKVILSLPTEMPMQP